MTTKLVVQVEQRSNQVVVREVPVAGYDAANALGPKLQKEFGAAFEVLLVSKAGKLVAPECLHCGESCAAEKRWCTACEAAGACTGCGDPMLGNGSVDADPHEGLCGSCVEKAADANRAAAHREYGIERALDVAEARR